MIDPIPEDFGSIDAAADFWDSHSLADYWHATKETSLDVDLSNAFSCLTHLECTACGAQFDADTRHTTCPACGKVLFARYDLAAAGRALSPAVVRGRPRGLWRWRELLPLRDPAHIVSLGEGDTPLLSAHALGRTVGASHLFIKEEGLNPTGSFKARGMAVAVSRARELGVHTLAAPSAGNAAAALAAYGARAGMAVHVFVPADTPPVMVREAAVSGAHVTLVDGRIDEAGRQLRAAAAGRDWFDVSTLKEPYRVEGKKTLGFELAEQCGWRLPDAIIYPTGGGTGLVGMWKAFAELEALGWIGPARPKMITVQAAGCAPLVRAFQTGARHAEPWPDAHTLAAGLRVPAAIGDYLILDALRASGGAAIAVDDQEILAARHTIARHEGLFPAPEGAATFAAYQKLLVAGFLGPADRVVLFNTAAGNKTPEGD